MEAPSTPTRWVSMPKKLIAKKSSWTTRMSLSGPVSCKGACRRRSYQGVPAPSAHLLRRVGLPQGPHRILRAGLHQILHQILHRNPCPAKLLNRPVVQRPTQLQDPPLILRRIPRVIRHRPQPQPHPRPLPSLQSAALPLTSVALKLSMPSQSFPSRTSFKTHQVRKARRSNGSLTRILPNFVPTMLIMKMIPTSSSAMSWLYFTTARTVTSGRNAMLLPTLTLKQALRQRMLRAS
mmetsp:Transcript_38887/g.81739  ORF Transcript_38887/g.81739 Transcript_38887/m.81739 type:complete len:236 (-) Transcript_38887:652-1359(-)